MPSCCGILELSGLTYGVEGHDEESYEFTCCSAEQRRVKLSDWMNHEFGRYPMVVLTDVVDGPGMRIAKMFKHPNWTKKIIKSERKNPNSGNMLMMAVFTRRA
jgi:hypothetical protein